MIKQRTIFSFLISFIVVVSILPIYVCPQSPPSADWFVVSSTYAEKGEEVMIPVSISEVRDGPIISIIFNLFYDKNILELKSVLRDDLTAYWDSPTVNPDYPGGLRLSMVYDGVTEHGIQNGASGNIVVLVFKVLSNPGSKSKLEMGDIQLTSGFPYYLVGTAPAKNGKFWVTGTVYGSGYSDTYLPDGKIAHTDGVKTYMLWNGIYIPEGELSQYTKIAQNGSNYEIEGIFGGLRVKWDGSYYYSEIYAPDTKEIKSYGVWTRVESLKTPPSSGVWQEETVNNVTFVKVTDTKLVAYCTLSSGGKLNHTFQIVDNTRIKESYEVTAGYARKYQVVKRIDSIPSQGSLDNSSKKFNPAFFENQLLWTWGDIPPYTVNETGAYLYGYNTFQYIDQNNHWFYQTVGTDKIRAIGEKFMIDPSWTVGIGGNSWSGNVTYDNTTKVISTGKIELRQQIDNYVSYLRMDENTGIIAWDQNVTSNNTGTWNGNTTGNWTTGKFGTALSFDGIDDYVSVLDSASLDITNAMTVEAWVYIPSFTSRSIISKYNWASQRSWLLQTNINGIFGFTVYSTGASTPYSDAWSNSNTLSINTWYHLAAVFENQVVTLYYNGVVPGQSHTSNATSIYASTANVVMGSTVNLANYFNGTIDEVRIYDRTLSNNEINLTMNNSHYTSGNLTSTIQDASSGYMWKYISFNSSIPSNTNITIYTNTSETNASFTNWQLVQTNASTNTLYTLPVGNQQRYGQWGLQFVADNYTLTPEVLNVTFYSETSAAPDTSFTVTLPTGYTYAHFQPSNSTATNWSPDGQTPAQAFYNITNAGNVNLKINMTLNSTLANIILKADTDNNPVGAQEINTTNCTINNSLPQGKFINVWIWSDFFQAINQSTNRTIYISVNQTS